MTRPAPVLEIIRSDGDAETVEAALPALQTELTNLAKLNGYTVE